MKPILIGIAGPSCSGKSTLAKGLEQRYPDRVVRLRFDDFYIDSDKRGKIGKFIDWDSPNALKLDLFHETVKRLQQGKVVKVPDYNKRECRQVGEKFVAPKPFIIVEGLYVFYNKETRALFDRKFFITVEQEAQWKRRVKRQKDIQREYFEEVLIPQYEKHGLPSKKFADHIIDGNEDEESVHKEFFKILREHYPELT
jgi:uridine kinase